MKAYGIGPKDEVTGKYLGARGARVAHHRARSKARRAIREEIEAAVVQRQEVRS